jgi:hypothetical protein
MATKYRVHLTDDERADLHRPVARGRGAARALTHARILKAAESPAGPAWPDTAITHALDVGLATIWRVRKRCVQYGPTAALARKPPDRVDRRKLAGELEARLIALACSPPPMGRRRWTLQLLAARLVEFRFIDGLSYQSVRRTREKTSYSPGGPARVLHPPGGCPAATGLHGRTAVQLVAARRQPRPVRPGRQARYDDEYVRHHGTKVVLTGEPLHGRRQERVTTRRTRRDWAHRIKQLVNQDYPADERMVLVLDNLNTHPRRPGA